MVNTPGWTSFHVFYAANANPFLLNGVGPLVARLRADGLIDGWFFIRYWMEGPHIRLRLKPRSEAVRGDVEAKTKEAIEAFLSQRPALYEDDRDTSADIYKKMFLAEYGETEWDRQYGADGTMPFRDNNTVHRFDYEREYERYGGDRGMEVSERHFEFSSDQILRTIATTNVHVRSILLGQAAQQTLLMAYAFFDSDEAISRFFLHYRRMWEASYDEPSDAQHEKFDQSYEHIREPFLQRVDDIRRAAHHRDESRSTSVDLAWITHGREIRAELEGLYRENLLSFRDGAVPGDVEGALTIALSSYIHMSNNRLGVSILDEVYISYMVCRALETANIAVVI